jgi:hypothetical protein
MEAINVLLTTGISLFFLYALWKREGYWRHILAAYWSGANLAIISLGARQFEGLSELLRIVIGFFVAIALIVVLIPVYRYFHATKDRSLLDNWDPGVSPLVLYLCSGITAPLALFFSYLSQKMILWPDVGPPYSYILLVGFSILVAVSLMAMLGILPANVKKNGDEK